MALESCPPLGSGSVDMHALHLAASKGKLTEKVIEDATTLPAPEGVEAAVTTTAAADSGDAA